MKPFEYTIYIKVQIRYGRGFVQYIYSRAEENVCLVLFRRQNGIFGSCDYNAFPQIMGASAYFEVSTICNVQI